MKKSPKRKVDLNTIKRLWNYIKQGNKIRIAIAIVCIIVNTIGVVAGSLYLQVLIDNYITPLIGIKNADLTSLIYPISVMIGIYAVAIITIFICTRVMVKISQGTQKIIRDEMFTKMQLLPIKYFDTHTHGDIMSHYTNDIDTLNQMISQSMPQVLASLVTIITVFIAMIFSNWILTLVVILTLVLMLSTTKIISGKSGKYFVGQQKAIGEVNGYIEEMINGQKVIKVFCHEEKAKEGFDKINDRLLEESYKANKFANVLMPVLVALGNLQYVLVAIVRWNFDDKWNRGSIYSGLLCLFFNLVRFFQDR